MVFNNVTDLSDPKNLAKAIREYLHLKVCPVKSSTLPDLHQRVKVRVLLPLDQSLDLDGRVVRLLGRRGFLLKFRRHIDMSELRSLAGLPSVPTGGAPSSERAERTERAPQPSAPKPTTAGNGSRKKREQSNGSDDQPDDAWNVSPVTGPIPGELIGQLIDNRYSVTDILGQGGMGVVYEATHKYLNRKVAIKVLQRALAADEAYVARFLREAQAVAALKNRHTITVHDFGVTGDGQLYFAMELLEGLPMSDIIEGEAPISFERAAGFLMQVCDSLTEAHVAGILHRDLKPDNLFISEGEEGEEFVTVLDFGIAKKVSESTPAQRITATGMIPGTPHYISPEQAHGREATPCSDLYALGVILYEMLCGHPPFDADSGVGVLLKHIQELPTPLTVAHPFLDIHPSVDDVLAVLLDKDPKRRPQTAREFSRLLRETLDRIQQEEEALMDPPTAADEAMSAEDTGRPTAPTALRGRADSSPTDPESVVPGDGRSGKKDAVDLRDTDMDFADSLTFEGVEDETTPLDSDEGSGIPWLWIGLGAAATVAVGLLLWRVVLVL